MRGKALRIGGSSLPDRSQRRSGTHSPRGLMRGKALRTEDPLLGTALSGSREKKSGCDPQTPSLKV